MPLLIGSVSATFEYDAKTNTGTVSGQIHLSSYAYGSYPGRAVYRYSNSTHHKCNGTIRYCSSIDVGSTTAINGSYLDYGSGWNASTGDTNRVGNGTAPTTCTVPVVSYYITDYDLVRCLCGGFERRSYYVKGAVSDSERTFTYNVPYQNKSLDHLTIKNAMTSGVALRSNGEVVIDGGTYQGAEEGGALLMKPFISRAPPARPE